MAFNTITWIGIVIMLGASGSITLAARPSSTISPDSSNWADPFEGGRPGNPGARSTIGEKSMDAIHEFASDMLGKAMLASTMQDIVLNIGVGTVLIKTPKVTEAKYAKNDYKMRPPNMIDSYFYEGQLAANGVWQYKPLVGDMMGGTYKAQVRQARINATDQMARSADARPFVNMKRCVSDLSNFRVEVQGLAKLEYLSRLLSNNMMAMKSNDNQVFESCDTPLCTLILNRFEDEVCHLFEGFVKEVINKELQQVPTKMSVQGDQFLVDYGLLWDQPKVNESSNALQAGLEGKYIWRNSAGNIPFNPPPMEWTNPAKMYTFYLSDFAFNTLFQQAHSGGHRFSARDSMSSSSTSSSPSSNSAPSSEEEGDMEILSLYCQSSSAEDEDSPPSGHARKMATQRTKSTKSTTTTTPKTTKSTTTKRTTTPKTSTSTSPSLSSSTPGSSSSSSTSTSAPSNPRKATPRTKSTKSTTTPKPTTPKTSPTTKSTTPKTSPSTKSTKSTTTRGTTTRSTPKNPRALYTDTDDTCMGSIFTGMSNFGPYQKNQTGDVVFKTNRAPAIFIRSNKNGYFDASNGGSLEFYGPIGQNGQRPLLTRADVRSMRGQFIPKLNKANITGTIKLDQLELTQSSQAQMPPEWFEQAAKFSKPLIERALNVFLERFAQFTVPLPPKYECWSPSMTIFARTVELDCDIRQINCETETACRCFRDSCVCTQPCDPKAIYKNNGKGKGSKIH